MFLSPSLVRHHIRNLLLDNFADIFLQEILPEWRGGFRIGIIPWAVMYFSAFQELIVQHAGVVWQPHPVLLAAKTGLLHHFLGPGAPLQTWTTSEWDF